jgi:tetratricopeptide (TPR) repeat protein
MLTSLFQVLLFATLPVAAPPRLGTTHLRTSCDPKVGAEFDHAVALLHSFEYDEARDAFAAVAPKDPTCAMVKWGVAMARYRSLWGRYHAAAGAKAVAEARALAAANPATTDREKAYIAAIAEVFSDEAIKASQREDDQPDVEGYSEPSRPVLVKYKEKMAALHTAWPDDDEATVACLALNTTARRGDKTRADLRECTALLKPLFVKLPDHPGIAHYIIHCSDNPEMAAEALDAARKYAAIAPASAHATHMPSHIFAQLGLWDEMVESNIASMKAADADHESVCRRLGEKLHAMNYLAFSLAQTGRLGEARDIVDRARSSANEACDDEPAMPLAGYVLETGEWGRAKDVAVHGQPTPVVEGTLWLAIGVGAARTGDVARASLAEQRLAALRDVRAALPGQMGAKGTEAIRLAVAAWSAHTAGRKDEAERMLREAADLQDGIGSGNSVVKPVRELLADMLMLDGKPAEALVAYRSVLDRQPRRFISVFGAGAAADATGDRETAKRFYEELGRFARGSERPELVTARTRLASLAGAASRP